MLHWRLRRICAHLGIDLASLRGLLNVLDLVGQDAVLWERDPRTGYTITPGYTSLMERVREYEPEVILVHRRHLRGAWRLGHRVKRYVNGLVALIPADRGAVVLIVHHPKANGSRREADARRIFGLRRLA